MKTGIIIIFRNNESSIKVKNVAKHIQSIDIVKFCLVDNYSNDNTLQLLYEIKEECVDNVEIVEVKKMVSEAMAKKAGARYLSSYYNLKYIGYINLDSIQNRGEDLESILEQITQNDNYINDFKTLIDKNNSKQNFIKGIFSIVDSIKEINKKYKPLKPSI